jgi:hypothetical protein
MSIPGLDDNIDEGMPLASGDGIPFSEREEVKQASQMLMKYRSDYLSSIDRETLAEKEDLFVLYDSESLSSLQQLLGFLGLA